MSKVTIEGSISPSTYLARGERATVQRTEKIDRLIERGFVVVVDDHADAPHPVFDDENVMNQRISELEKHADAEAQKARDELGVPPRNGSGATRAAWAEFLSKQNPPIEFTDDDGRDELIALWDDYDPEA